MARALVTGASSGIGRDIARELSLRGYDIILVARNKEKLEEVKREIKTNCEIIPMDISKKENCEELYDKVGFVDILVNNAGFGIFGKFSNTSLDREVDLINTNILAVHTLTKLFLKAMIEENKGYILNVASIAGHMPGPLMSSYYASKAYVYSFSTAINEELRRDKLNIRVGSLNPGPVRTNFNKVANVKFNLKSISSDYCVKYTVDKMLKGKTDITPGIDIKLLRICSKLVSSKFISKIVYKQQKRKEG